jgi:serine/threonine protein kinase
LGLAALHERNIVYRDLKPDNILMDDNGYTRLSDLGLACKVPTTGLAGACGTRGYWAPEMIRRDAQGKRLRYFLTVDWFSFGCVVYEFLVGVSPFRTEAAKRWGGVTSKAERDKAIDDATIEMEPYFDDNFDPVAKDLCSQLLEKDPTKRLGRNGAQEVMAHPFFNSINWVDFKHSKVKPPLVPNRDLNMASQAEIGMFSDDKQSRKMDLTEADQAVFNKWIFVNKKAFQDEVVGFMRYEELNVSILTHTQMFYISPVD